MKDRETLKTKLRLPFYCSEFNRLFKKKINVGEIITLLGEEQKININFHILDAYILSGFSNRDLNSAKKIEELLWQETDLIFRAKEFLKLSSYYFILGSTDDAVRVILELEESADNNPIITEPLKEFLQKSSEDRNLKDILAFLFETTLRIPYTLLKNQSLSSLAVAHAFNGSEDKAQYMINRLEYPEFIDDTYSRIAYIYMSKRDFIKAFNTALKIAPEDYRYSVCMDIVRAYGERTIPDWGFFEKIFFRIKKLFGRVEKRPADFELSVIQKIVEKEQFQNNTYSMEILSNIALMLYYNNHFDEASSLTEKIINQTESDKVKINNLALIYLLKDKKKAEIQIDNIKSAIVKPSDTNQEYFDLICALADYYNKTDQSGKKKHFLKLMDEYLDLIPDDFLRTIMIFEKCNEYRWLLAN